VEGRDLGGDRKGREGMDPGGDKEVLEGMDLGGYKEVLEGMNPGGYRKVLEGMNPGGYTKAASLGLDRHAKAPTSLVRVKPEARRRAEDARRAAEDRRAVLDALRRIEEKTDTLLAVAARIKESIYGRPPEAISVAEYRAMLRRSGHRWPATEAKATRVGGMLRAARNRLRRR